MNQNVNLDLIPKFAVFGNLYFSQYDVGRTATINLLNGTEAYTIPVGATVKIQATKPSGLGFNESCTFSGNVVTVVSTETMTDEAGRIPCELRIEYNGDVLGTANFLFNVERSPHPDGTTDGTADSVISQITLAYETAMDNIEHSGGLTSAIKNAILNCFQKVAWIDQNGQTYYNALSDAFFAVTNITLNASSLLFNSIGSTQQLTATLVPSDSTAQVQWESSDTSVATVSSSGLVTSVADGNVTITASVGEVYATCSVTVEEIVVDSINAVLNASGHTFYAGDDINDIKPYLTVTATYSDSTTATIPSGSYTLSGSLVVGENTITVSYEGVSTTVTVTAVASVLTSISAVYTQSGTVYDTDSLDSLKADLVVTATYSDSSTETVPSADYTLSGTLTVGTSTVTVSYMGITTTFNVTVTEAPTNYNMNYLFSDLTLIEGYINDNGEITTLANNELYNELINAVGFCLTDSSGNIFNSTASASLRIAEYDSSSQFVARTYETTNDFVIGSNSPSSIKMGFSGASTVQQSADRFVAVNPYNTTLCTIPDMTLDTNGDAAFGAGTSISDYLPINSGVLAFYWEKKADTAVACFYDSSKSFISRHPFTQTLYLTLQGAIAIPSNASYVRFRCDTVQNGYFYASYINE